MNGQINPVKVKQVIFISCIVMIAALLAKELYFAFGALLGAITLYVLLINFFRKLTNNYKWRKWIAAFFIIMMTIIIIVIPLIAIINYGITQITPFVSNPQVFKDAFEQIHQYLLQNIKIDILDNSYLSKINNSVLPVLQNAIGGTASSITSLAIMYFIFYYMLVECDALEKWVKSFLPFNQKNNAKFLSEAKNVIYGNTISIPILAIVQGVFATVGYWFFGVNNAIIFGMLTAIASVIPVVGTAIVYLPVLIYLLATGNTVQGLEVLLWNSLIVGSVDNVVRFSLAKKIADVHPLITIFGVFIGVSMFGFLGIIYGPLLISLFILLIKIYFDEYANA